MHNDATDARSPEARVEENLPITNPWHRPPPVDRDHIMQFFGRASARRSCAEPSSPSRCSTRSHAIPSALSRCASCSRRKTPRFVRSSRRDDGHHPRHRTAVWFLHTRHRQDDDAIASHYAAAARARRPPGREALDRRRGEGARYEHSHSARARKGDRAAHPESARTASAQADPGVLRIAAMTPPASPRG
jgi:hypothetical protein